MAKRGLFLLIGIWITGLLYIVSNAHSPTLPFQPKASRCISKSHKLTDSGGLSLPNLSSASAHITAPHPLPHPVGKLFYTPLGLAGAHSYLGHVQRLASGSIYLAAICCCVFRHEILINAP